MDPNADREDIIWNENITCTRKTRPKYDGCVNTLWPMIMQSKMPLLDKRDKSVNLLDYRNVEVLTGLICSNGEDDRETLKKFLVENEELSKKNYEKNNTVRTSLNKLVLGMSRLGPYQDRMQKIYTFDYEGTEEAEKEEIVKDADDIGSLPPSPRESDSDREDARSGDELLVNDPADGNSENRGQVVDREEEQQRPSTSSESKVEITNNDENVERKSSSSSHSN